MKNPTAKALLSLLLLWLAVVLDVGLGDRLGLWGARPNLTLVVLLPICLLTRPSAATWAGFMVGLLYGAAAGANLAHYVISRAMAGFLTSSAQGLRLEVRAPLAGLFCALGTIVAQGLLMFLAPPVQIGPFLAATMGTALFNGVLSMPVYAVLQRLLRPRTGLAP